MRVTSLAFVFVVSLLCGCERDSRIVIVESQTNQRDNREAELAALWISGNLIATDFLYDQFDLGFSRVRDEFLDSIPEVGIGFHPPWVPGAISVHVTDETKSRIRNGVETEIDSLSGIYGSASVDTFWFAYGFNNIRLTFDQLYHPYRLAEAFRRLPSITEANPVGFVVGNEIGSYPWLIPNGTSYLFRYGWQDCPSGCIYNRYWYLRVVGTDAELVGVYDTSVDPEPDWWTEARVGLDHYRGFVGNPVR